jgi:DNA (cytosine-5)-methyltransferase 1
MERLGYGYTDDGSTPTLRAQPGDNQLAVASAVAVPFQVGPQKGDFTVEAPTLDCRAKNGRMQNQIGMGVMQAPSMQVRRLTPRECERLQGFPDDYTQIPWRGKSAEDCPDGPRYRALGNSWAVPVVRWIGQRIAAVLEAAP